METQSEHNQESNLMYFLRLIISNWKWLLSLYLVVAIVSVIYVLVIPKWYKSDATVVILSDNSSPISGLLSEFSAFGFGLGGNNSAETYLEYARTTRVYDSIIEEFNIMDENEFTHREDAYEFISENLNLVDNENGTFSISFLYQDDPVKAKEAVEFVFSKIDEIALEVDVTQASKFRKYIEVYYQQTRSDLNLKEDSLVQFQKRTGIIDLPTQIEATIIGISDLEKEKIGLEVEKNYLSQIVNDRNRLLDLDLQIKSIDDKLIDLKTISNSSIIALESLPEEGIKFLRLQRDILVGEKVSEFLRLQYEQAILDEKKIDSNLYLVDVPVVADKKFKPQRGRFVITTMFITFVLSMIAVRVKDYIEENTSELLEMLK